MVAWVLTCVYSDTAVARPSVHAQVATVMDDVLLIANCGDCRLLLISEAVDSLGNRTAYVAKVGRRVRCLVRPHLLCLIVGVALAYIYL